MPVGRSVMYDTETLRRAPGGGITDARRKADGPRRVGRRKADGPRRVGRRELGGPDESGKATFNVQLEVLAEH